MRQVRQSFQLQNHQKRKKKINQKTKLLFILLFSKHFSLNQIQSNHYLASEKKKKVSKKKKQNSFTKTNLPQPKLYPLSSKKPAQKKKQIYHAAGVMSSESDTTTPYHEGVYQKFPKEIIQSHILQYNVVPYPRGTNPRPLSAAQITSFRNKSKSKTFFPKFFMNPYQDLDYMVLQDIYANSMGGRIIDRKEELKFGQGIRPVLKLRRPDEHGDEEQQQKLLEDNQHIIEKLTMVDDALGDPDDALDPYLDTDVNTKFQALSKNASVFGRSMIIKESNKRLVLADGTSYPGIPNVLKVIHPRDMGLVEIDQDSWKLKSVQIRFTAQ